MAIVAKDARVLFENDNCCMDTRVLFEYGNITMDTRVF